MKARKVIITLEVVTDAPVDYLRKTCAYSRVGMLNDYIVEIIQAQANVQQEKKSAKGTP